MSLADQWRTSFFDIVQRPEYAGRLKNASQRNVNTHWTQTLTNVVVTVCEFKSYIAAAKGHKLLLLPESRSEYLGIDVIGFEKSIRPWTFPFIAVELENSRKDDRIGYSLWKVLSLHAKLRIVFCYRPSPDSGPDLVNFLENSIVDSLGIQDRLALDGETLVVMGYRNKSETFPYGFFKWWKLELNTGKFETMR